MNPNAGAILVTRTKTSAFTLVELIIVIIILGILASLAIPSFLSATSDAEEATLRQDLAILRKSISLYYHQHGSDLPGVKKTDGSGNDANGLPAITAAFLDQITLYTDKTGKVSNTFDRTDFPLGPYFQKGIPTNPLSGLSTVRILIGSTSEITADDIKDTDGWVYAKRTGEIRADSMDYLSY